MHGVDGFGSYHTVIGALSAYGAESIQPLGQGTPGLLGFAIETLRADGGLLCGKNDLLALDKHGAPLDNKSSSALESAARRQELPPLHADPDAIRSSASLRNRYVQSLAKRFYCGEGMHTALRCEDRFLFSQGRHFACRPYH